MVESVSKYQRYAEYKDSGVEWLGKVPSHWDILSIARISNKITNGYVGATRDIFFGSGVRYLQSLHIKNNTINFHTPYYVSESWSNEKSKSILKQGDVLIVQTGDIGQVAAVTKEFEGCNCHALIIVSGTEKISGFYLAWFLNSNYGRQTLKSIQTGALHPHLNCDAIKDIKITLPDIYLQKTIANFLDHETAKIDSLIEKQKQLIQLLKEKRQAVISHAVTKGLDPSVKMKDSGVEWLGEVPEHWEIGRLKNVLSIKNGRDYKAVEVEDGGYPVYGSGGIFKRSSEFLYDGISLLFGRKGTIDKPLLVKGKFWTVDTMFYSELVKNVDPEYIYFQSLGFPFDKLSTNTALPSMTQEDLLNLGFVIPPVKEQTEISKFIKQYLEKNHSLMKKAESAIQLMQERRTALISAAVTGKIDVRHWKNAQEVLAV